MNDDRTYEQLVAALEEVAQQLASDTIGIEAATALYEQAEELHRAAADRLAAITKKIETLTDPGADSGN
jgi:exodeoxyribonuclease VII small subunit